MHHVYQAGLTVLAFSWFVQSASAQFSMAEFRRAYIARGITTLEIKGTVSEDYAPLGNSPLDGKPGKSEGPLILRKGPAQSWYLNDGAHSNEISILGKDYTNYIHVETDPFAVVNDRAVGQINRHILVQPISIAFFAHDGSACHYPLGGFEYSHTSGSKHLLKSGDVELLVDSEIGLAVTRFATYHEGKLHAEYLLRYAGDTVDSLSGWRSTLYGPDGQVIVAQQVGVQELRINPELQSVDMAIQFPVGTVVDNMRTGEMVRITQDGKSEPVSRYRLNPASSAPSPNLRTLFAWCSGILLVVVVLFFIRKSVRK